MKKQADVIYLFSLLIFYALLSLSFSLQVMAHAQDNDLLELNERGFENIRFISSNGDCAYYLNTTEKISINNIKSLQINIICIVSLESKENLLPLELIYSDVSGEEIGGFLNEAKVDDEIYKLLNSLEKSHSDLSSVRIDYLIRGHTLKSPVVLSSSSEELPLIHLEFQLQNPVSTQKTSFWQLLTKKWLWSETLERNNLAEAKIVREHWNRRGEHIAHLYEVEMNTLKFVRNLNIKKTEFIYQEKANRSHIIEKGLVYNSSFGIQIDSKAKVT